MSKLASRFVGGLGLLLSVGCSSDSEPMAKAERDAGDSGSDARPVDPFNGDCSSARWASVSDACWSCFCNRCKDALNGCNGECFKGAACAVDNHILVGVATELQCEVRAVSATCLKDEASRTAAGPLLQFDGCLINQHRDPEHLRACEQECGVTYTGDVCERFPEPDAGASQ
jgi:hypothetical protein